MRVASGNPTSKTETIGRHPDQYVMNAIIAGGKPIKTNWVDHCWTSSILVLAVRKHLLDRLILALGR